jgi:hypothetical protein
MQINVQYGILLGAAHTVLYSLLQVSYCCLLLHMLGQCLGCTAGSSDGDTSCLDLYYGFKKSQMAHLYELNDFLCEVLAFLIFLEPSVRVQPKACGNHNCQHMKEAVAC